MSIFSKIFSGLKDFFGHFFKNVAKGDHDAADKIELDTQNAITLINNIKAYLDGPLGDFVAMVIPGTWDDKLREKAMKFLDIVVTQEATLMDCLHLSTPGEQLACVYSKIVALADENQENSFWHKLGVLATEIFSDGKLDWSDSVLAAEFVYRILFKKDKTLIGSEA